MAISVPEIGLHGNMNVVAIKACPPIPSGQGRVVIGTFAHSADETIELYLAGVDEPIRCTPNHATWSHDRQAFVEAQDLQPGERVQALGSTIYVRDIRLILACTRVFNLQIHGERVYQVAKEGMLVHNAGEQGSAPGRNDVERYKKVAQDMQNLGDARNKMQNPAFIEDVSEAIADNSETLQEIRERFIRFYDLRPDWEPPW